jgi:ribose 5-phosphate isomerase RpiB
MRVGIAADLAVFAIKKQLTQLLRGFGHDVRDFGPSGWIDFRTGDSCR